MFGTWCVNCIRHGLCEFHDFETHADAKAWVTDHADSLFCWSIVNPDDDEIEGTA